MVRESYYWSPERRRRLKIARRDSRDGGTLPQAERTAGEKSDVVETDNARSETPKTVLNPEASSDFEDEKLPWYKRVGKWAGRQMERVGGVIEGVKDRVREWREAAQKKESDKTLWERTKGVTGMAARGIARVPLLAMKGVEKVIDKGVAVIALGALFSDMFLGTSLWETAASVAWNGTLSALNTIVNAEISIGGFTLLNGIHPIAAPGILAAPVLLFARVFLPAWSGVRKGLQEFVERK